MVCNKCKNYKNNESKENIYFCETCGQFLGLINKKIQFKENISHKKFNSLKKILIEVKNYDNIDINWYSEIIMSYLIDITNIKQVFEKTKINYLNLKLIIDSLPKNQNNLILYYFLVEINKFYDFQKDINEELRKIIIYTNLPKNLKSNKNFTKVLNFFKLKIFKFEDYFFEYENDDKYVFNSNYLMFEFSETTRDINLLKSYALKEIYSFFGYITYLNKFNKTTHRYHINELTLNHRISDIECYALIVTDETNKILRLKIQYEIITNSKIVKKSKIKNLKNKELIKDFNNEEKQKISKKIKEYFYLYYLASSETNLENSFLKFWSLSEKIIKDVAGDMKDSKLKKLMKKILKGTKYPKYIIKRIDHIQTIRNSFVHENNHEDITSYDQSLVKVISERLIDFLIYFLDKVDDLKDYGIILEYSNIAEKEKRKLIKLIELTIPPKSDIENASICKIKKI